MAMVSVLECNDTEWVLSLHGGFATAGAMSSSFLQGGGTSRMAEDVFSTHAKSKNVGDRAERTPGPTVHTVHYQWDFTRFSHWFPGRLHETAIVHP